MKVSSLLLLLDVFSTKCPTGAVVGRAVTQEDPGSNPASPRQLFKQYLLLIVQRTKVKKKMPGNASLKKELLLQLVWQSAYLPVVGLFKQNELSLCGYRQSVEHFTLTMHI